MKRDRGLTLLEILIVCVIVAVLSAITFSIVSAAQTRSKQTVCVTQMKQVFLAMEMYAGDQDNIVKPLPNLSAVITSSNSKVFRCPEHSNPYKFPQGYRTNIMEIVHPDSFSEYVNSYAYVGDVEGLKENETWYKIASNPGVGVIACAHHGNPDTLSRSALWLDFEPRDGMINRVCFDGHLMAVKRTHRGLNFTDDLFFSPLNLGKARAGL